MPSIIARVTSSRGEFLGVHATFLTTDGRPNVALGEARKLMLGATGGGAVWFGVPSPNQYFVVGEGIETTLSAMHDGASLRDAPHYRREA